MKSWVVVVHYFSTSTQEAEPGLQSEFQNIQGYTEKPCLEKPKKGKIRGEVPRMENIGKLTPEMLTINSEYIRVWDL